MKKIFLLFCLLSLAFACKYKSEIKVITDDKLVIKDSLTMVLDSIYKQSPIVGFSVAIIEDDTVLYNKGFGFSDVVNNKEYTANTIQTIGSISKTFIGISLLKAQELDALKLDDNVNDYLPFKVVNPKHPEIPITLRQLATHTSSIIDSDYYAASYVMLNENPSDNERVIDYFQTSDTRTSMEVYLDKVVGVNGKWNKGSFADYKPGTTYKYSNIAATLAALVIEKATAMPFKDFTKKYILNPLNMSTSGWLDSEINSDERSRNYMTKDTAIVKYQLITYPDGGFITSTKELSSYLIEMMKGYQGKGTLLTQDSYKELFSKQLNKTQMKAEENSGIFVEFGKWGIGHNGGDPGVLAFMYFDDTTNIGKIVVVNTDTDEDEDVVENFKSIWKTLGDYAPKL